MDGSGFDSLILSAPGKYTALVVYWYNRVGQLKIQALSWERIYFKSPLFNVQGGEINSPIPSKGKFCA